MLCPNQSLDRFGLKTEAGERVLACFELIVELSLL